MKKLMKTVVMMMVALSTTTIASATTTRMSVAEEALLLNTKRMALSYTIDAEKGELREGDSIIIIVALYECYVVADQTNSDEFYLRVEDVIRETLSHVAYEAAKDVEEFFKELGLETTIALWNMAGPLAQKDMFEDIGYGKYDKSSHGFLHLFAYEVYKHLEGEANLKEFNQSLATAG